LKVEKIKPNFSGLTVLWIAAECYGSSNFSVYLQGLQKILLYIQNLQIKAFFNTQILNQEFTKYICDEHLKLHLNFFKNFQGPENGNLHEVRGKNSNFASIKFYCFLLLFFLTQKVYGFFNSRLLVFSSSCTI
jgi:hypothetical protein